MAAPDTGSGDINSIAARWRGGASRPDPRRLTPNRTTTCWNAWWRRRTSMAMRHRVASNSPAPCAGILAVPWPSVVLGVLCVASRPQQPAPASAISD